MRLDFLRDVSRVEEEGRGGRDISVWEYVIKGGGGLYINHIIIIHSTSWKWPRIFLQNR